MKYILFIVTLFIIIVIDGTYFGKFSLANELNINDATLRLTDDVKKDVETFITTQRMSQNLKYLFKRTDVETYSATDPTNPLKCFQCKVAVYTILSYYQKGYPLEQLTDFIVTMCTTFLYNYNTCVGLVELNLPTFLYILEQKPNITAEDICRTVLQPVCIKEVKYSDWQINAYIDVPKKVPEVYESTDSEPLKIVHISDIHFDFEYLTGSNTECDQPLCCRGYQGVGSSEETSAGYWGHYGSCDGPLRTVENALHNIQSQNLDKSTVIYYTGDTVSHNVWNTTYDQVKDTLTILRNKFNKYFKNYQIYPILGNHDTQPLNLYAPHDADNTTLNSTWLYEFLQENWQGWLPDSVLKNLKYGGFYSVKAGPKLRVIGLNSNICYTFNWWLLLTTDNLREQLQWFADELLDAEQNGEFVHVLSHIPPGVSSCDITWEREFWRIISRFSHIVKGMFNGHTHYDEFTLMFDDDNIKNPIGMAFNTGGVTTWKNVNPNYRILHVDPNNYDILDYEQWIFNLTYANEHFEEESPQWYKLYSFKDAYNLTSLSLPNLKELVYNLATNKMSYDTYKRFKGKNSDAFLATECKRNQCVKSDLCDIVTSVYKNTAPCKNIINMWKTSNKKYKYW